MAMQKKMFCVAQEDYTTDEEMLTVQGLKAGAGGILDLLKASKQVAGLDPALRYRTYCI